MRSFVTMLIVGLLSSLPTSPVFSQPLLPVDSDRVDTVQKEAAIFGWADATFVLSAGVRSDELNWSIAGNQQGGAPNVRSDLSWSDLEIYQLKLFNRTVFKERVAIRGHLDYGAVLSGDNRDSDYNGDNRTQEVSRSLNGVDGNSVWDASFGAGPRFSFFDETLIVCPMAGYAVSEQDLNIVDGYQAFSAPPANLPIGPITGLDSRYQTRWNGPWLGADLLFRFPMSDGLFSTVGVILTGEYHWVDYDADANWNLRADYAHPVSFTHEAQGHGLTAGAVISFETNHRWGINVGMSMKRLTTDPGLDRNYYADGTVAETRLNEVRWRSLLVEAGVSYQF